MKIQEFFQEHPRVAVAVSGGVDSAALLCLAKEYAEEVCAYFVRTPFQPDREMKDAMLCALSLGVQIRTPYIDVLTDSKIASNPENRCYYCKKRIFTVIKETAAADGFDIVLDGTNATDDVSDRPGMQALKELGILSPLRLCGITKAEARRIAAAYCMTVSDKPSYACLATRIPANTPITNELLERTDKAERNLIQLGFRDFRVRWEDGNARLELSNADFKLLGDLHESVYEILTRYYQRAFVDLKARTIDG